LVVSVDAMFILQKTVWPQDADGGVEPARATLPERRRPD
jgi:hypothetical protein